MTEESASDLLSKVCGSMNYLSPTIYVFLLLSSDIWFRWMDGI
jgi:hypothetical protein